MQSETLRPLKPIAQGILNAIVGIDAGEMLLAARRDAVRAAMTPAARDARIRSAKDKAKG